MGNKSFFFFFLLVIVHLLLLEESLFCLLGILWRLAEALASFLHSSGSSHLCLMSICDAHKNLYRPKSYSFATKPGILPATKNEKELLKRI